MVTSMKEGDAEGAEKEKMAGAVGEDGFSKLKLYRV